MFKWCRGLTLAEIACIIGVSGLTGGIAAVVVLQAGTQRERAAAASAIAALNAGVRSFETMRGGPPSDLDGDGMISPAEVVSQLKSWGILEGSFEPVDPWGRPYVIVFKRESPAGRAAEFERTDSLDEPYGQRSAGLTAAGVLGGAFAQEAVYEIEDPQL